MHTQQTLLRRLCTPYDCSVSTSGSCSTLWAISGIVLFFPLCESFIAISGALTLIAHEAFMAYGTTLGADRGAAHRADKDLCHRLTLRMPNRSRRGQFMY